MFDYKVVNSALDNLLVSGGEIIIDFSIKRGVRKLPQSFFSVKVGPPNDQSAAFVGRFNNLCSDDSDFSLKSEEMCNFFNKRGYAASVVEAGHHRAQQIDRQSALQTSQRDNDDRIPFTLTFHPHNHAVKSIILKKL